MRGARPLAALEHKNIVRVYDGCANNEVPFIAMQFFNGKTFDTPTSFGLEEKLVIMIDKCEAIEHAHRNGVLHGGRV